MNFGHAVHDSPANSAGDCFLVDVNQLSWNAISIAN